MIVLSFSGATRPTARDVCALQVVVIVVVASSLSVGRSVGRLMVVLLLLRRRRRRWLCGCGCVVLVLVLVFGGGGGGGDCCCFCSGCAGFPGPQSVIDNKCVKEQTGKRILVTGAGGRTGSLVVEKLVKSGPYQYQPEHDDNDSDNDNNNECQDNESNGCQDNEINSNSITNKTNNHSGSGQPTINKMEVTTTTKQYKQ